MTNNSWIEHVKQFQKENNLSFKDALKQAKETYHTGSGGNKNAGYIRRLYAEKQISPESFFKKKPFEPSNIQIQEKTN